MAEQRSRWTFRATAMLMVVTLGVSGCSTIRKAPGLNQLFGEEEPVFGIDPTQEAGIDYEIDISGLGVAETVSETEENARIRTILEGATRIYRLQDKPPPNIALLRRRAASDVSIIERALKSEGYYEGEATITVTGTDPGSTDVATLEAAAEAQEAVAASTETPPEEAASATPVVKISVRKGPRYSLARQRIDFVTPVSPLVERAVQDAASINVGGPAQGRAVVDGELEAASIMGRSGWPYVDKGKRRAEANFDVDTLDVITKFAPGPFTTYGPATFEGLETVELKYVASFIPWNLGDPVSRPQIAEVQRQLSSTRLFDAVSITLPETPPENWRETGTFQAPVKIAFEESKHRKAALALNFSTVDGPGAVGTWEHRNLYGQNETLRALLDVSFEEQRARVDYRKPRFQKTERDFIASVELFHEDREAFEVTGITAGAGIEEKLSKNLVGTLGVAVEAAQTRDDGLVRDSYLVGLPGTLKFDDTDDLLNPTEGLRITALVTPWAGAFDEDPVGFVETDFEASTYYAIDRDARYILASRGRVATVLTDDADNVPANRRVFSGGGGSVRAYSTQFVNDLDSDGTPIGAVGAFEGSLELRMRFGSFGVVPFLDAGAVTNGLFQEFGELRWGGGLGVRYFSPVGPIRVDVALPGNRRSEDDAFQLYLSIGQAF